MYQSIQRQTTIQSLTNSFSRSLPPVTYHYSLLTVLLLVLACFGLAPAPNAFGVTPAPDGGYSGANTAEGDSALFKLTTGTYNTATGYQALFSDTTGIKNTANGAFALAANTTGGNNAANGFAALYNNTTGNNNTANGGLALYNNTTGGNNTANGLEALFSNTIGIENTATGDFALYSNTTGTDNAANGFQALYSNTTGYQNAANGSQALFTNTTGYQNAASGYQALYLNTDGSYNTADGDQALANNTHGSYNTAIGYSALDSNSTGSYNLAGGYSALSGVTTGSNNIAFGTNAGANLTTGDYNIDISNQGNAGEANTIRIGSADTQTATFIAGVSGTAVVGNTVVVSASGQLGVLVSSGRFKDEIKLMDKASEAIFALQPVTFHYKHELDPQGIPQFGLVAEDVAKVNRDLVTRDAEGKILTVRYEAVNAMLLNEFLKEHRKVQEQEAAITQLKSTVVQQEDFQATIAQQQEEIRALTVSLKEQASQIQKVSAQLDLSSPRRAAQLAGND